MSELKQSEVRRILDYDPDTGDLTWLIKRSTAYVGRKAGSKHPSGYMVVGINGKILLAHRVIWLHVYGYWPNQVDHINHIVDDNRLINLREVNRQENQRNTSQYKNNKSGITGVRFRKRDNRWVASIKKDKDTTVAKTFMDKFEAICFRKSAENRFGYHTNHGETYD